MNQREKETYLREYTLLKAKGKPFFPYAVAKDAVMMCIVMAVIISLSIVLGAELGPKADPTTTTYVPRPEWYFFFLFEVLRVIKPPELVPFATIGVPTICMIMLFLLPFIDRGPERRPERRPIATLSGILVIVAMGYLTFMGAEAGSPNSIDMTVPQELEKGKLVAAQSGCLACHKFGENGNDGPGPELTEIGAKLPAAGIKRTLINPSGVMPVFAPCGTPGASESSCMPPEKFNSLVNFLASLQ
jgi:quinol---cytochrome c reductase cytochrome c subunit, bacillus type